MLSKRKNRFHAYSSDFLRLENPHFSRTTEDCEQRYDRIGVLRWLQEGDMRPIEGGECTLRMLCWKSRKHRIRSHRRDLSRKRYSSVRESECVYRNYPNVVAAGFSCCKSPSCSIVYPRCFRSDRGSGFSVMAGMTSSHERQ